MNRGIGYSDIHLQSFEYNQVCVLFNIYYTVMKDAKVE